MSGFGTIGEWTVDRLNNWMAERFSLQGNIRSLVNRAVADATVPAGVVAATAAAAAPDGYLLCDGTSYLRVDHPGLFAAIGTTFGAADGTHFTVPDLRQKFPLGKAAAGTGATLGGTGGAIDHTHTYSATTGNDSGAGAFADSAIGAHDRTVSTRPHTHTAAGTTDASNPPYVVLNFIIKL